VFQSYAIWPHMTVAENIAYPLSVRRMTRTDIVAKVAEVIRLVKLDGLAERLPTELSGGQQQRVALARALAYEPDIVLLDEPLSNLDSVLRKEMRLQLKALQSRLRTSFLYVTHDQEEAMSLSTRVAVMNGGRIEQMGAPAEIYERPATSFVQGFVGATIRLRGVGERGGVRIGSSVLNMTADGVKSVEVTVRPEDVALAPTGPGIAGRIAETTYFGDRIECAVAIDGAPDQIVMVNVGKNLAPAPGTAVVLVLDPARVRLWPL
jgi:putative spermidine/putrescine transport system ATP-binding protein